MKIYINTSQIYVHKDKKKLYRKNIRIYMRTIRQNLTFLEQYIASQLITNKIIINNDIQQSKNIAIFFPFDKEINTIMLIHNLLLMNKKIYLPILSHSKTSYLFFARYTLSTSLKLNRYHIYEPYYDKNSIIPINELNIIFVPLVAFDNYGNRLGMGGGFYDKTLQKYKTHNTNYIPIGISYDFQKISKFSIPTEQWDITLPEIITPSHHWYFKKTK